MICGHVVILSFVDRKITSLANKLEGLYGNAEVMKNGKTYRIEPEFSELMTTSRDWEELKWAWLAWRDATGPKMKPFYTQLVEASNQAAQDNGEFNYQIVIDTVDNRINKKNISSAQLMRCQLKLSLCDDLLFGVHLSVIIVCTNLPMYVQTCLILALRGG